MHRITTLVGILFSVAPLVLRYSDYPDVFWISMILGMMVLLVSTLRIWVRNITFGWGYPLAGLGLLAISTPLIQAFKPQTTAMLTNIILGGILLLAAGLIFKSGHQTSSDDVITPAKPDQTGHVERRRRWGSVESDPD